MRKTLYRRKKTINCAALYGILIGITRQPSTEPVLSEVERLSLTTDKHQHQPIGNQKSANQLRAPLYGFLIGILLNVILWFCGPFHGLVLEFLCTISTPVAYIISWITGWKFMQEEGILIYVFAIPITIALSGLLAGFMYSGIKVLVNRSSRD